MSKSDQNQLIAALASAGIAEPEAIIERLQAANLANIAALRAVVNGEPMPEQTSEALVLRAEDGLWSIPSPAAAAAPAPRSRDWAFD